MATTATGKYYLKSVHEEIALFDRKLAHLDKYQTFGSDKERKDAERKLATKRKGLVSIAQRLVSEGVEFNPSELPRSLRTPEDEAAALQAAAQVQGNAAAAEVAAPARAQDASPFAGTSLDWQASVNSYLAKKKRK